MTHIAVMYFVVICIIVAIFWYLGVRVEIFYSVLSYISYFFIIIVVIVVLLL